MLQVLITTTATTTKQQQQQQKTQKIEKKSHATFLGLIILPSITLAELSAESLSTLAKPNQHAAALS